MGLEAHRYALPQLRWLAARAAQLEELAEPAGLQPLTTRDKALIGNLKVSSTDPAAVRYGSSTAVLLLLLLAHACIAAPAEPGSAKIEEALLLWLLPLLTSRRASPADGLSAACIGSIRVLLPCVKSVCYWPAAACAQSNLAGHEAGWVEELEAMEACGKKADIEALYGGAEGGQGWGQRLREALERAILRREYL